MNEKATLIRVIVVPVPTIEEPRSHEPGVVLDNLSNRASMWNEAAKKAKELIENNPYGLESLVFPFTTARTLIGQIRDIQSTLRFVLIEGLDENDCEDIKKTLWDEFKILVIDPKQVDFVKNNVEGAYQLLVSQLTPLTKTARSGRKSPVDRYQSLRALMENNLTIAQIAEQMNMSVPSIYNLRTRFKDELLRDVGNDVQGMRFTTKNPE